MHALFGLPGCDEVCKGALRSWLSMGMCHRGAVWGQILKNLSDGGCTQPILCVVH